MSPHNLKVNVYFFISCPTFGPLFHPVIDTAMIICVTLPQKENIQFELLWIKEALELQQNICVKGFSLVKENVAVKQRHIYSRQLQGHDTTFQYYKQFHRKYKVQTDTSIRIGIFFFALCFCCGHTEIDETNSNNEKCPWTVAVCLYII